MAIMNGRNWIFTGLNPTRRHRSFFMCTAAARLRHIAGTQWGMKRYMNMDRLKEFKREQAAATAGAAG